MTTTIYMGLTLVLMVLGSYSLYKFVDACRDIDHPVCRFVVRHQLWFLVGFMLLCVGTMSSISRRAQEPTLTTLNTHV